MLVLSFHLLRYAHHNIGQVFFFTNCRSWCD